MEQYGMRNAQETVGNGQRVVSSGQWSVARKKQEQQLMFRYRRTHTIKNRATHGGCPVF